MDPRRRHDIALLLVQADRLTEGRLRVVAALEPAEDDPEIYEGVGPLVEEVRRLGQRHPLARERLRLFQATTHCEATGPHTPPQDLSDQVIARRDLRAELGKHLGLVGAVLGKQGLPEKRRGGRQQRSVSHLFEGGIPPAQDALCSDRVAGEQLDRRGIVRDGRAQGKAELFEGGLARGQQLARLIEATLHGMKPSK